MTKQQARHHREITDTRNLQELIAWLEYGKTGYRAARCSQAQEEHWAALLRDHLDKLFEQLCIDEKPQRT